MHVNAKLLWQHVFKAYQGWLPDAKAELRVTDTDTRGIHALVGPDRRRQPHRLWQHFGEGCGGPHMKKLRGHPIPSGRMIKVFGSDSVEDFANADSTILGRLAARAEGSDLVIKGQLILPAWNGGVLNGPLEVATRNRQRNIRLGRASNVENTGSCDRGCALDERTAANFVGG